MTPEAYADLATRYAVSFSLGFAGLVTLAKPQAFAATAPLFPKLAEPYQSRLCNALAARKSAEGVPMWLGRALGALGIGAAAAAWLPQISPFVPYALWCLAFAVLVAVACVGFRSATRRHVAVLQPRSLFDTLPLPAIVAIVACIAVELALVAFSPLHPVWGAMALASATLFWVGRQIATAPALIVGDDPAVERFVDDRVRAARAINVAGLVVAPAVVCLGAAHDFSPAGIAAWVAVGICGFVVAVYAARANRANSKEALTAMAATA